MKTAAMVVSVGVGVGEGEPVEPPSDGSEGVPEVDGELEAELEVDGMGEEDCPGVGDGVPSESAAGALPVTRTPVLTQMTSGLRTARDSTATNLPIASPVKLRAGLPHESGKNHAITSRLFYQ